MSQSHNKTTRHFLGYFFATTAIVLGLQFSGTTGATLVDLDMIFDRATQESTKQEKNIETHEEEEIEVEEKSEVTEKEDNSPKSKPDFYTQEQPEIRMFYQPGPQYREKGNSKKERTTTRQTREQTIVETGHLMIITDTTVSGSSEHQEVTVYENEGIPKQIPSNTTTTEVSGQDIGSGKQSNSSSTGDSNTGTNTESQLTGKANLSGTYNSGSHSSGVIWTGVTVVDEGSGSTTLYEYEEETPFVSGADIDSGSTNNVFTGMASGHTLSGMSEQEEIIEQEDNDEYSAYVTSGGITLDTDLTVVFGNAHLGFSSRQLQIQSAQSRKYTKPMSKKNLNITLESQTQSTEVEPEVSIPAGTTIRRSNAANFEAKEIDFYDGKLDQVQFPTGVSYATLQWGLPNTHLTFSQPIEIVMPVNPEFDGQQVTVMANHYGYSDFDSRSISNNPNSLCLPDGTNTEPSDSFTVTNGFVRFYSCGASTFIVTYVGGPTPDNFVDNDTLDKTITVTTGEISAGTLITDVQVIVDFQPIDSEDPTNYGTTNAYSDEVSMSITSPQGTTVDLLLIDTYTNQAYSPRVQVTFDDAAATQPSGLPATGTFLPEEALSAFSGEDPLGDWTFTIGDDTNQDGVILFGVSLQITDNATCGDGITGGAEGCDDGGTSNGDGCSDVCLIETNYACNIAGSGALGNASCASSVCDTSEATPTCEAADVCGNNLVESGEQCDDGNTISGDGCDSSCELEFCGDGLVDLVPVTGGVLFLEGFESIGNGTATASGTVIYSSTGYRIIYQNDGAPARARYGTTAVQANGGAGAMTFDVSTNNNLQINYAIFEVDLSDALGATDLELAFAFSDHGEESNANDRVWIRGSDTDAWVQIYDWYANQGANGTFINVNGLDIDSALAANTQQVSDTFQIRFGQEDNFPANSTTANDGLTIDDIQITGTPPGPSVDEECDDNNTTGGDGCSSTCTVEPGYVCIGEPSICTICGDGSIDGAETCDDGNTANGDGCDNTCQQELGWSCAGAPSSCTATCGDGIPVGSEECDDGGTSNGDGCSSLCFVEPGYSCGGVPSACTAGCGNGITGGSEQCDDGNTTNGDGCSDICRIEFCGNGVFDSVQPVGGTLFLEDFESIGNGTETVSDTVIYSETGYRLIYQHDGAPARMRYGTTAIQAFGGAGAATLDVSTNNNLQINYMIMEVDLSSAVGANDLELAFDFSHHGEESQSNDRVWVRGSDTDAWVEIYDWDANKGGAGTYINVTNLDIDNTLSTNGQSVSDTFQIRFGQEDNFPANNTTTNDGLSIDNVEITGTPIGPTVDETCDDGNANSGDGCSATCQIEPDYTCVGEPSVCTYDNCDPENVLLSYLAQDIDDTTTSISFSSFTNKVYNEIPIVLATPQTDNNTNNYPIPVITNITTGGFDISICVDAGDTTCVAGATAEDVAIFVVDIEATACTDHIEAGTSSIATNGSDTAFVLSEGFNNTPYVFTTPQTNNQGGNIAAVAWVDDGTLTTGGGDFVGCVHQAGSAGNVNACTTGQPNETLGWLAIDPLLFAMTGYQNGEQGISNSTWTNITFSPNYTNIPAVMVTQNSDNGGQDPEYAWARDVTTGSAEVRYCEQDAAGVCDNHTSEDVMWFSLPYSTLPPGSGDVCIFEPGNFSFSGSFRIESYAQVLEQQFSGYFEVEDTLGVDSGYYTTLQVSDFTGLVTGNSISNSELERNSSGVDLLSGDVNPDVVLASGWDSYRIANTTYTFLKRDPATNSNRTGTYGTRPWLRLTIPAYQPADTYKATITYTLYEN